VPAPDAPPEPERVAGMDTTLGPMIQA
jgi:hypothetical protein